MALAWWLATARKPGGVLRRRPGGEATCPCGASGGGALYVVCADGELCPCCPVFGCIRGLPGPALGSGIVGAFGEGDWRQDMCVLAELPARAGGCVGGGGGGAGVEATVPSHVVVAAAVAHESAMSSPCPACCGGWVLVWKCAWNCCSDICACCASGCPWSLFCPSVCTVVSACVLMAAWRDCCASCS